MKNDNKVIIWKTLGSLQSTEKKVKYFSIKKNGDRDALTCCFF